jgi:hypothetical protein
MRIDKEPYEIRVSEEQVWCLEVKAADYEYYIKARHEAEARLRAQKEARREPNTYSGISTRIEARKYKLYVDLLTRTALSLRYRGRVEMKAKVGKNPKRIMDVEYWFGDDESEDVEYSPEDVNQVEEIHRSIPRALFQSEYPDGGVVEPLESSFHQYLDKLRDGRLVRLVFEPGPRERIPFWY